MFFERARVLRIGFREVIFIADLVYFNRYGSCAEAAMSTRRAVIDGVNRALDARVEPFHRTAGNPFSIRTAGMRPAHGRLARSGDRATVALSGRACLLREAAERGMIDQFAMQRGGLRALPFLTFCQPCPLITRRFPVPSSCRSTRSCPKNRC
ncbi:hypothetical protein LGM58_34455 [Burkholderia contaminans]|uniref:hypothetical protein n=1 Tax=Burkholderia contaminans TaxID=488447 RepID=UPI001CF58797|nr:hypothetical protein [Burkholderia contaminans]MCA7888284.1 hypothetical protein [Burkholderia contaminans]